MGQQSASGRAAPSTARRRAVIGPQYQSIQAGNASSDARAAHLIRRRYNFARSAHQVSILLQLIHRTQSKRIERHKANLGPLIKVKSGCQLGQRRRSCQPSRTNQRHDLLLARTDIDRTTYRDALLNRLTQRPLISRDRSIGRRAVLGDLLQHHPGRIGSTSASSISVKTSNMAGDK